MNFDERPPACEPLAADTSIIEVLLSAEALGKRYNAIHRAVLDEMCAMLPASMSLLGESSLQLLEGLLP